MNRFIPPTPAELHQIPYSEGRFLIEEGLVNEKLSNGYRMNQCIKALLTNDLQLLDALRADQCYPLLNVFYTSYHQITQETINWLLQHHPKHAQLKANLAAKEGRLEGSPDRRGVYWAAKGGHLDLLQKLALKPNCKDATAAACHGHLETVKWIATHTRPNNFRQSGVPTLHQVLPSREAVTAAIQNEDWSMFEWLMTLGYIPAKANLTLLLEQERVKWLQCFASNYQETTLNDLPYPKELVKALLNEEWSRAKKILDRRVFTSAEMAKMMTAAETGDLETLKEIYQKKTPIMNLVSLEAARHGHVEILDWLLEHELPIRMNIGTSNVPENVLNWKKEHAEELQTQKCLPTTLEEARLVLSFITPKRTAKSHKTYNVVELRQIAKNLNLDQHGKKAELAERLIVHLKE